MKNITFQQLIDVLNREDVLPYYTSSEFDGRFQVENAYIKNYLAYIKNRLDFNVSMLIINCERNETFFIPLTSTLWLADSGDWVRIENGNQDHFVNCAIVFRREVPVDINQYL